VAQMGYNGSPRPQKRRDEGGVKVDSDGRSCVSSQFLAVVVVVVRFFNNEYDKRIVDRD